MSSSTPVDTAFYIKQNDTYPPIDATLSGEVFPPIPSGATVEFHMTRVNASTAKVSAAAMIVDATTGKVSYAWQAGDTDTAGTYQAEFQVSWTDTDGAHVMSFPNDGWMTVTIVADLG